MINSSYQNAHIRTVPPRQTPPPAQPNPAPDPDPDPQPNPEPDPDGFRDWVEGAARWVVGKAVGFAFGTSSLAANVAAGGARGIVHGARIEKGQNLVFQAAMTANLALIGGMTGGPPGAGLSVLGGHLIWQIEGEEVRNRVAQTADAWVDRTLAKLPGNPDEAGAARRVVNGAIGEVIGGAAGAVAGTFAIFKEGEAMGEAWADQLTGALFGEDE